MGLGIKYDNWIQAANEGNDYGVASSQLQDYFILTQYQIGDINSNMRSIMKAINETAFVYYECNAYGSTDGMYEYPCDG